MPSTKQVPKKLTPKMVKFVHEYLIDLNATQAAIRAGYSKNRADQAGWNLLRKIEIQEALDFARQSMSAKSGITPEKVIQGFADVAFADISECYDESGALKNIHEIPKSVRMAIAGLETLEEFEGTGAERVVVGKTKKLRMWDKLKGLDSLAKHFGLYNADKPKPENQLLVLLQRIDGHGLPSPGD